MSTQVKELVAVPHSAFLTENAAFKQLVVMFDRLAVQALSVIISNPNVAPPEFTWLAELGIVFEFDMEKLASDPEYQSTFDLIGNDLSENLMPAIGLNVDEIMAARGDEEKLAEVERKWADTNTLLASDVATGAVDPFEFLEMAKRVNTNLTRLSTSHLRTRENLDAYTVVPSEHSSLDNDDQDTANHDVVKIVLPTFPVPDEDVTWQQILEYRNGPDPQNKFRVVKNWISEVARGSFTPDEAEEKLEHLLNQYRRRLELHQMKTSTTTLEAFVVTTQDVLDRFRSGERALFSLTHRKLALLQGESTSAGSEVAYVIKTKSLFPF
jgi:hypothetical protein